MKNSKIWLFILVCTAVLIVFVGCDVLKQLSLSNIASSDNVETNDGDLAPRSFALLSPPDGATGISLTPTLSWNQAIDPEGQSVSYTVLLKDGQGSLQKEAAVVGTSYMVAEPLLLKTTYY